MYAFILSCVSFISFFHFMFSSSRHKFELLLGSQLRFVLRRNIPQALPPYILNDFEKKTHQLKSVLLYDVLCQYQYRPCITPLVPKPNLHSHSVHRGIDNITLCQGCSQYFASFQCRLHPSSDLSWPRPSFGLLSFHQEPAPPHSSLL